MVHVWGMSHASAAAVRLRSVGTVTSPVTWTVVSLTPAASQPTAWRSAWSAAASASPPEETLPFKGRKLQVVLHVEVTWINLDQCGSIVLHGYIKACCSTFQHVQMVA